MFFGSVCFGDCVFILLASGRKLLRPASYMDIFFQIIEHCLFSNSGVSTT